jgi:hypothetical protein
VHSISRGSLLLLTAVVFIVVLLLLCGIYVLNNAKSEATVVRGDQLRVPVEVAEPEPQEERFEPNPVGRLFLCANMQPGAAGRPVVEYTDRCPSQKIHPALLLPEMTHFSPGHELKKGP